MTKPERTQHEDDSLWVNNERSLVCEGPDAVPIYDLEGRTARFSEAIIDFARKIPRGPLTDRTIDHLVGAGTSVGANYIEADDSVSKKEFLKGTGTCKKEARETEHFLRRVARALPELQGDAREPWLEARALHLIFARIWRTGKGKE